MPSLNWVLARLIDGLVSCSGPMPIGLAVVPGAVTEVASIVKESNDRVGLSGVPPPWGVTHQAGVAEAVGAGHPTSSTLITPPANMAVGATPAFGVR